MMLLGNPYAYFYWKRHGKCVKPDCAYCRYLWNGIWRDKLIADAYEVLARNAAPLMTYEQALQKYARK